MVTKLKNVYNGAYKKAAKVYLNGNVYYLEYMQTSPINANISKNEYMKIEIEDDEAQRYVLRYHNYNIAINDALGKKKDVADYDVHTYWKNDEVDIDIHENDLQIKCVAKHLGIYNSAGKPENYYHSVTAKHLTEGGITVTGFGTVEGESTELSAAEKEKDKDEEVSEDGEASMVMKGLEA